MGVDQSTSSFSSATFARLMDVYRLQQLHRPVSASISGHATLDLAQAAAPKESTYYAQDARGSDRRFFWVLAILFIYARGTGKRERHAAKPSVRSGWQQLDASIEFGGHLRQRLSTNEPAVYVHPTIGLGPT